MSCKKWNFIDWNPDNRLELIEYFIVQNEIEKILNDSQTPILEFFSNASPNSCNSLNLNVNLLIVFLLLKEHNKRAKEKKLKCVGGAVCLLLRMFIGFPIWRIYNNVLGGYYVIHFTISVSFFRLYLPFIIFENSSERKNWLFSMEFLLKFGWLNAYCVVCGRIKSMFDKLPTTLWVWVHF